MAQSTSRRRRKKTHSDQVREILCEHSPEAAQCLCSMLEDETLRCCKRNSGTGCRQGTIADAGADGKAGGNI